MNELSRILVLIDHRPAEAALATAAEVARATGARLTAAEVVEDGDRIVELIRRERRAALERTVAPLRARGFEMELLQLEGTAPGAVAEAVERHGFDLIIQSADGGTDSRLLRRCPAPLWIATRPSAAPERILAAVDPLAEGDDARLNHAVVDAALVTAQAFGAALEVVSAWTPAGPGGLATPWRLAEIESQARRGQLRELERLPAGIPGSSHLVGGPPAAAISEVARRREPDLLVVGTKGREGVAGLVVGNTAERVLKRAGCSLLVVPKKTPAALKASAA